MITIKKSNVYPKHTSLIKGNKKTENFFQKLDENPCKPAIMEAYHDIDSQIEIINGRLMDSFKKQEEDLLNYYMIELTKAQSQLKILSENMNEEMLKKKMNDRKAELEKEKSLLLQNSLQFSNQCTELKGNLQELVFYSEEIQDELKFLDEQLVYADQQNSKLAKEAEVLQQEVLKIKPDFDFQNEEEDLVEILLKNRSLKDSNHKSVASSTKSNQKRSASMIGKLGFKVASATKNLIDVARLPQKLEELSISKEKLAKQKYINKKLKDITMDSAFEMGFIEKKFSESIEKIKKKSAERIQKKSSLPSLNRSHEISSINISNVSKIRGNESLSTEISVFEPEFNDLEKRLMMEDFFSDEEVKKYVYKLLFEKEEPKTV